MEVETGPVDRQLQEALTRAKLAREQIETKGEPLDGAGGPPHDPGMEHRVARLEDDVRGIRSDLTEIKDAIATTREDVRHAADVSRTWGMWTVGTIIATGVAAAGIIIAMNGLFLQASGNQLSAFQAGLATIQAVAAAKDLAPITLQPAPPPDKDPRPATKP